MYNLKSKKKFLILAVVLMMAFALVGCSETTTDDLVDETKDETLLKVTVPSFKGNLTQALPTFNVDSVEVTITNQTDSADTQTNSKTVSGTESVDFSFTGLTDGANYDVVVKANASADGVTESFVAYKGSASTQVAAGAITPVEVVAEIQPGDLTVDISNLPSGTASGKIKTLPLDSGLEANIDLTSNQAKFTAIPADSYNLKVQLVDDSNVQIEKSISATVLPGYSKQASVDCSDLDFADGTATYQLDINSEGSGTVNQKSGPYEAGSTVSLTATPAEGYRLDSWVNASGTKLGGPTDYTIDVTMDAAKTVTAKFVQESTLTVNQTGEGTIDRWEADDYGYEITLWASPATGYAFSHWEDANGNELATTKEYIVTMDTDKTVTAVFIEDTTYYNLTVSSTTGGNVDKSDGEYKTGTDVTLTPTADSGYQFDHWEDGAGNILDLNNPATITMDADKTVKAVFVETATITTKAEGEGTVSPTSKTAKQGEWVELTATPADGYILAYWVNEYGDQITEETLDEMTKEDGAYSDSSKTGDLNLRFYDDQTITAKFIKEGTVGLDVSVDWETGPNADRAFVKENIDSTNDTSSVTVNWYKDYEAEGVMLYRSTSETGEKVPLTDSLIKSDSYEDTDVTRGNTYWYWVAAYDSQYRPSKFYEPVSVVVDGQLPQWKFTFDPEAYGVTVENEVHLVGDFNSWDPSDKNYALTQQDDGTWTGTFELSKGERFKFMYDSTSWDNGQNIGTDGTPMGSDFTIEALDGVITKQ